MDTQPSHAWQFMYPPLQCHARGWLEVGDGHQVYWEISGNPAGAPALFVHGGPGAGCTPTDRRWFDPAHYRIVLFDQRGAGRSQPQGRLEANTTQHLVRDIEALRTHLDIDTWLVLGGSWGATLALAYAQSHPRRVQALVLRGVFLATQRECHWLYSESGVALSQPAAWQRLTAKFDSCREVDVVEALSKQLHCGQRAAELDAARAWLQWEHDLMDSEATGAQLTDSVSCSRQPLTDGEIAMARIGVHYARNAFFMGESQLMAGAARLHPIPGLIVQGEADLVTPPAAARALHRAWPVSRLCRITGAGHAASHPVIAKNLIAATDFFRDAQPP